MSIDDALDKIQGSSPRVRGSLEERAIRVRDIGIIPAGAGLTFRFKACRTMCGDHPRGCGAHLSQKANAAQQQGSSPRVRGSRRHLLLRWVEVGIIPAGAGLTSQSKHHAARNRDHPRGCGAHAGINKRYQSITGSSPRVRGSRKEVERFLLKNGIIPAGAGLTPWMSLSISRTRDHPRGCGAHWHWRYLATGWQGSSPRVRGSQRESPREDRARGIIPAGAGLTRSVQGPCCRARDHPRGCGAHSRGEKDPAGGEGSSPRVRGSRCRTSWFALPRGIIPAGAGLTLKNPNICAIPYFSEAQNHSLLNILTGYSL